MTRLNKLILILVSTIFIVGTISLVTKQEPQTTGFDNFEKTLKEAQDFYKSEVGYEVRTPIKPFDYSVYKLESGNVLAYCYLDPSNTYIAFNHPMIEKALKESNNPDFVFQVILHEYTHCEGGVGHVEMYGHFMNDGGAPWLSKEQVKEQFKDYLKYYRNFYKKFPVYGKEEIDMNNVHALKIWKDSDGNIKTSCTCSSCVK